MEDEQLDSLTNFTPQQPEEGFQVNPMETLAENIRRQYPDPVNMDNGLSMDAPMTLLNSPTDRKVSFQEFNINPQEAYHQLPDGTNVARYENFLPGVNNAERLAQQQSTGQKWARGLRKLGLKTGTAVLGGTVGSFTGIANAIKEGSFNAMYTDDFNKMLDTYNEKLDFTLQNYYTEEERNMGFMGSLGTANFWANDFLGGLSFTLGTIVSEGIWTAATGGVGTLARGVLGGATRWSTKALGANKALRGLAAYKEPTKNMLNQLTKQQTTQLRNATTRGASTVKALNQARFIYTSAGYEAGVEARHYMKEAEEEFITNFQEQHGRRPTPAELAPVRESITNGANAVYGANVALVGGTNMAVFGKMLLGKSTSAAVSNSAIKRQLFGVGYTMKDGVATAVKATRPQRIAGKAYSILKAPVIEGAFEEGGQSVISTSVKDYILAGFDPDATEESISMMESIINGFQETYGTKEGRKEVGLGFLIGLFGGGLATGGRFNEVSQERRNIENIVNYRNEYTADRVVAAQINAERMRTNRAAPETSLVTQITAERMKANNRIIKANENAEQAQANNDLSGEFISEQQAVLASIERDAVLQGTEQGIRDFEAYLNTVDNAELAKELGIEESQVNEWKQQKVNDYREISNRYKDTERYVRALLGDNTFAGLTELNTSHEQLVKALTYNITLGEQSKAFTDKLIQDIKTTIGTEVNFTDDASVALDVDQVLTHAPKEAVERYQKLATQQKALEEERARLENQLLSAQYNRGEQTSSEQHASRLHQIQGKIVSIQEQIEALEQRKEVAYRALGIQNDIVTLEDIDNQADRVKQLQEQVEGYKRTNPELYITLTKLFDEYNRSKSNTVNFQRVTQELMDPKFRVDSLNGWLTGILKKNKSLDESTKEFFAEQLARYETNRTQGDVTSGQSQQTRQEGQEQETTETVDDMEAPTVPSDNVVRRTPLEIIRQKIEDIMKSNDYTTTYIGNEYDEAVKNKPSQEDIDRYEELLGKINSTYITQYDQLMNAPEGYFNINNIETGLTAREREELKQLQNKLSNWKVLEGSLDNDNNSISDLLLMAEQLETQVEKENTKTEIEPEEYATIKQAPDQEAQEGFETSEGVQSPDQAMVRLIDERGVPTYSFSHVDIRTLERLFPGSSLELVEGKKSTPLNDVKESKRNRLAKKEGTKYTLITPNGNLTVTVGKRGRLNISKKDLDAMLENTNIAIVNYGTNSYMDVYEILEDGTAIPLRGDFSYESALEGEVTELVPEVVNNVKEGQILITRINKNDSYNKALLEEYEASKKTEEDLNNLMNNLHVYITDQTGQVVGSLRASQTDLADNAATKNLLELRRKAVKMVLDPRIQEDYFSLGEAVPVRANLIGSPNFTIDSNRQPVPIDFTETALEQVESTGYFQGETLRVKGMEDTSNIVKTFLPKSSSQKMPVVILNVNGKQVAFPVSLKSEVVDRSSAVNDILNSDLRATDKITRINAILIQHGLNPSDYAQQRDGVLGINEEKVLQDLSEVRDFPNVEDWIKDSYQLETLMQDAQIGINLDNKPFNLSKIMLDLSNSRSIGIEEQIRESYNDIESRELKIIENFQEYARTIDRLKNSYPDEISTSRKDVHWVETLFGEGELKLDSYPDNYSNRMSNVNLIREATRIQVPSSVVETHGQEFFDNIKRDLTELDRITEQKRRLRADIKNAQLKNQKNNQNKPC